VPGTIENSDRVFDPVSRLPLDEMIDKCRLRGSVEIGTAAIPIHPLPVEGLLEDEAGSCLKKKFEDPAVKWHAQLPREPGVSYRRWRA